MLRNVPTSVATPNCLVLRTVGRIHNFVLLSYQYVYVCVRNTYIQRRPHTHSRVAFWRKLEKSQEFEYVLSFDPGKLTYPELYLNSRIATQISITGDRAISKSENSLLPTRPSPRKENFSLPISSPTPFVANTP